MGLALVGSAPRRSRSPRRQAEIAAQARTKRASSSCSPSKYAEATAKFRDAAARAPEAEVLLQPLHVALSRRASSARRSPRATPATRTTRRRAQGQDRQARRQDQATTRRPQNIDITAVSRRRWRPRRTPPTIRTPTARARRPDPNNPAVAGRSRRLVAQSRSAAAPASRSAVRRQQALFVGARPEQQRTRGSLGVDFFGGGGTIGRQDFSARRPAASASRATTCFNPAAAGSALQGYIQHHALRRRARQDATGVVDARCLRPRRRGSTSTSARSRGICASRRWSACSSR